MRIGGLRLDVHRLVAVERVHDRRQHQTRRIGARKSAVAVGRPLHRRAHAVAVAEMDVVAHADLVAVIDHRRAGHRQQQVVHQFDPPAVVLQQRRQSAADAEIEPRAAIGGIGLPQEVALARGDHLERQLVVVAQEDRPLAVGRDLRRLAQDIGDRKPILARDRHVHARHQREVERHVAFVAVAEIVLGVLRPLVGLGEQHAVGIVVVDLGADALQHRVGLGQVLVVGALALHQVRHGIEPQPVDAEFQPVAQDGEHLLHHPRVVEVEVRLVRIEAVPVIRAGLVVESPVRAQRIDEDDAGAGIFAVVVRPHIEVAVHRARLGTPRALEPRVLVRRVVDHQLGDHPHAARVRHCDEPPGVGQRAVVGMHAAVVADVVAVVEPRRRVERQQPDRVDAEIGDVVELGDQAGEIANPVVVRIEERFQMELIDDRVLVPLLVLGARGVNHARPRGGDHIHHAAPAGTTRQIANGRSAGSRRMRWFLPVQTNRWPRIRSVAASAA